MKDRASSETKPIVWVDIQGIHDEMKYVPLLLYLIIIII
jgi:hypothetical protein